MKLKTITGLYIASAMTVLGSSATADCGDNCWEGAGLDNALKTEPLECCEWGCGDVCREKGGPWMESANKLAVSIGAIILTVS